MTDFTILGFHMYGPKSGYDIKRFMGMSTAHFYQASTQRFGLEYYAFLESWLERLEKELS